MLFHEEISFFPHPCQLCLFGLLDGIGLAIFFGDGLEDGGEVASAKVLHHMELVHAQEVLLRLWMFGAHLGACEFVGMPVLLLALNPTVEHIFASNTSLQIILADLASLAAFSFYWALHNLNNVISITD